MTLGAFDRKTKIVLKCKGIFANGRFKIHSWNNIFRDLIINKNIISSIKKNYISDIAGAFEVIASQNILSISLFFMCHSVQ